MSHTVISFPLSKFSWASDRRSINTFTWKHTLQDLVVVFDSFGSNQLLPRGLPSQMVKVIQGTKTLEFVDIREKARTSKTLVDAARRAGIQLRTEDLPCSASHRRTAGAITVRYDLPDDFVHHFELHLTSLKDFHAVLAILESSGLTLIDSTPSAAAHVSRAAGITDSATEHSHPDHPITSGPAASFSQMQNVIPPRRQLPFKRRGKNQHGSSNRAPTSTLDLPPLPEPHFIEKNAERTIGGHTAEALEDSPANVPVERPDEVQPNTSHGAETEPVPFVMPSAVPDSPPNAAPDPPPAESIAAPLEDALEDALERMRPCLGSNDKETLDAYAALPNEERMRVLEDKIAGLIGDGSFAQFCEDLSACCQIIGRGK